MPGTRTGPASSDEHGDDYPAILAATRKRGVFGLAGGDPLVERVTRNALDRLSG